MSFRKPCHMPFRKLIPSFTLTAWLSISMNFRILLANYPLDVISINETMKVLPGYKIVRRDRNRNGGGVCFYIKTAITYLRTESN